MLAAHYTAFKARLEGHTKLVGKVHSGVRVTAGGDAIRDNYVVAFAAGPDALERRFTEVQKADARATFEYDVRFVAVDADGVLQLAEAGVAQLVGHSLTVAGRTCEPIRLDTDESGRVQYDRTARLFYLDLTFAFETSRA